MYSIREIYNEAVVEKEETLILVIDYLVKERKALSLDDDKNKLDYYMQDRFKDKMNEYLLNYRERRT